MIGFFHAEFSFKALIRCRYVFIVTRTMTPATLLIMSFLLPLEFVTHGIE